MTTTLTPTRIGAARDLAARWDAQQTGYIRRRAERFDTIARVVASVCAEAPEPRILDLAGGTGALASAVLDRIPHARALVADKDPVLLAIAADRAVEDPRIETLEIDLSAHDWAQHPTLTRAPFDAIVSSTALHWLRPGALDAVYRALPGLMRPGGIVLNGDHLSYDEHHESKLAEIARVDDAQMQRETFSGDVDTWDEWWQAVRESGFYDDALARRETVWGAELHEAPPKVTLGFHLESLRGAGFAQTGTVWQYLDDHVLYGITAG